jgi:hypothetical protein
MRFVGRAARAHDRVEPHREQRSPTDRAADEGPLALHPLRRSKRTRLVWVTQVAFSRGRLLGQAA